MYYFWVYTWNILGHNAKDVSIHLGVCYYTIYKSQDMKTASMSTSRWMYKENVVHTHICICIYIHIYMYFFHLKNKICSL